MRRSRFVDWVIVFVLICILGALSDIRKSVLQVDQDMIRLQQRFDK